MASDKDRMEIKADMENAEINDDDIEASETAQVSQISPTHIDIQKNLLEIRKQTDQLSVNKDTANGISEVKNADDTPERDVTQVTNIDITEETNEREKNKKLNSGSATSTGGTNKSDISHENSHGENQKSNNEKKINQARDGNANDSISESCFDSASNLDSSTEIDQTVNTVLDESELEANLTSTPMQITATGTSKRKHRTDSSMSSDKTESNRGIRDPEPKRKNRLPSPTASSSSEEAEEADIE
jgi:hypothetical protein